MKRRLKAEEISVPAFAHDVPGGYPVYTSEAIGWDIVAHIFAPHMPSPRPRVTSRGTFMPTEYRQHCEKLAATLAYVRGLYEARKAPWTAGATMRLDLAFWGETQTADLDNLAKTVMDAGQLHRGEEPGAELWKNDRQIRSLSVDWIAVEDDAQWSQLVVRVHALPTREADIPIAAARRHREATKTTGTGDDQPKRQKARKAARERQQTARTGKTSV